MTWRKHGTLIALLAHHSKFDTLPAEVAGFLGGFPALSCFNEMTKWGFRSGSGQSLSGLRIRERLRYAGGATRIVRFLSATWSERASDSRYVLLCVQQGSDPEGAFASLHQQMLAARSASL